MSNNPFSTFVSYLLHSRTQAKVYHWQTKSFAAHLALDEYHKEIIKLIDSLVESYQGMHGIASGYVSDVIVEDNNPVDYFNGLCQYVCTNRVHIPQDSFIQNQVDEIVALINITRYKLTNLS